MRSAHEELGGIDPASKIGACFASNTSELCNVLTDQSGRVGVGGNVRNDFHNSRLSVLCDIERAKFGSDTDNIPVVAMQKFEDRVANEWADVCNDPDQHAQWRRRFQNKPHKGC